VSRSSRPGRPPRTRRITIVNQFYPPDLAPTAHLAASLAEHRANRGDEVTVITGVAGYVPAPVAAGRDRSEGRIRRIHLWTPALGKSTSAKRLSDYTSFLAMTAARLAVLRRQDVIVSLTTPPYVVVAALFHKLLRRRTRIVLWSMDCYPDAVERLGSMRPGGLVSRVLRAVNRWVFRHLDTVVCLDGSMRDLLIGSYGSPDGDRPPATVIPNWEAAAAFPPETVDATPWPGYSDDDLVDRFVVLYLGNLGYGHPVDTVVEAAALGGDGDVAWVFIGGGARWESLEQKRHQHHLENTIVIRGYVPKADTPAVMAGAGCALIVLADKALGVMSPSKLHANLAAGLPIVYVGPAGSNVDEAIVRFGCGVSLRAGDAAGLAAAVARLRDAPSWRAELSANARRAFEEAYCDRVTLPAFDAVIDGS